MLANMDTIEEKTDTDQEERKQEIRASQEHLKGEMKAQHERMIACLGRMEAMDLEANPEEKESEMVHLEVLEEHAAVKPVGELRKQHRGCRVPSEVKGTDLEICGSQKELTASGKNPTRDNMMRESLKIWTSGRKHRVIPEHKTGIRN
jgi:hypothetical protein